MALAVAHAATCWSRSPTPCCCAGASQFPVSQTPPPPLPPVCRLSDACLTPVCRLSARHAPARLPPACRPPVLCADEDFREAFAMSDTDRMPAQLVATTSRRHKKVFKIGVIPSSDPARYTHHLKVGCNPAPASPPACFS